MKLGPARADCKSWSGIVVKSFFCHETTAGAVHPALQFRAWPYFRVFYGTPGTPQLSHGGLFVYFTVHPPLRVILETFWGGPRRPAAAKVQKTQNEHTKL